MNYIARDEIKALKTLIQDGSNYTMVAGKDRCDNCYEIGPLDEAVIHLADCEVGIIERLVDRHPDIKTDMDLSVERAVNRARARRATA